MALSAAKSLPAVEWLKDGEPINARPGLRMIAKPDGSLAFEIDKTQPSDAGEYSVRVRNPHGEVESTAPASVNRTLFRIKAFSLLWLLRLVSVLLYLLFINIWALVYPLRRKSVVHLLLNLDRKSVV